MKRTLAALAAAALSLPAIALAENDAPATVADVAPARAVAAPASPPGPVVVVVTPEADTRPPERSSHPEVLLGAGVRGSLLPTAGFDPFSRNDLLFQGSFLLGVTALRAGPAAIVLYGGMDIGTRSDTARGQESSLTMYRFGGGAETRLYLHRRFYFDAKLAPVAYHLRGSISDDTNSGRPLVSRTWTWGLDVSGGAGVVLAGGRGSGVRLYLTLDVGYSFAGEADMRYSPTEDPEDPKRYGSIKLPILKPAGPTSRLGLALGF